MNSPRILCVDDEPNVLKSLERVFETSPYEVITAASAGEGLEILGRTSPVHVVITDYRMPSMDGVEFLKEVHVKWPDTVRMILSGHADTSSLIAAINEGMIYRFIAKPWKNDDLRTAVTNAVERYNLVSEKYAAEEALKKHLAQLEEVVKERTEQLENANERLHAFAIRLAEAEEKERRMIAREIHDRIGQALNTIALNLNIIKPIIRGKRFTTAHERLNESLSLVKETTKATRGLLSELRSPVLADYGLLTALRAYAVQYASWTGIDISVTGDESTTRPAEHIESAFYKIALEALTNVSKHSKATKVVVKIGRKDGKLVLSVADNGIGCNMTGMQDSSTSRPGLGLLTMRERALALGGECTIESKPASGTEIIMEAPL